MKKNYFVLFLLMCGLFFSAQAVNITFQVQMTAAPAEGVWIWIPNYGGDTWEEMEDDGSDLIYKIVLDIDAGAQLWYSYWISWEEGETIPAESRFEDANFRFLITPDSDYVVPVVGYGENQDPLPEKVDVTFQVELGGDSVLTNGMWMVIKDIPSDPWPWGEMPGIGNDIYNYTWQAFVNQTMRFTFVYSGDWSGEESVPEECNYGTAGAPERSFDGTAADSIMPVIPFGECISTVDFTTITYRVNMSEQTMNEGDIVWAYIWNDGSWPVLLDDDGDDIYTVELNHEPGTEIYYYYAFGTDDVYDEEVVPSACSDEDGYRFFTVGDEDEELPAYYYGSCDVSSGIDELNNTAFSIYPNPVKNIINIEFLKDSRNAEIILFDISGKVLYQNTSDGAKQMTIPVSNYTNGIYILQVQSSDKTYFEKILIDN